MRRLSLTNPGRTLDARIFMMRVAVSQAAKPVPGFGRHTNTYSMMLIPERPLVLVVDDDLDTRELYRVVLESVGYRVEDAGSVSGAAAILGQTAPDVVLTDWRMPDGDGLTLCRVVRGRSSTRHVPIVAVTGVSLGEAATAAVQREGIVSVLLKPADPDAILTRLRGALTIGLERRLRAAAARTKRYAEQVRRRTARCRGPVNRRADAESLLRRAAARSGDAVMLMIADDSARYVAVSGAIQQLTGYESNELASLSVWDLTPLPDTVDGQGLWRDFIASGIQEGTYRLRRPDGLAVEARYVALANITPGWHVSALAATPNMPVSLAGD